jgi:hypothetical protein
MIGDFMIGLHAVLGITALERAGHSRLASTLVGYVGFLRGERLDIQQTPAVNNGRDGNHIILNLINDSIAINEPFANGGKLPSTLRNLSGGSDIFWSMIHLYLGEVE